MTDRTPSHDAELLGDRADPAASFAEFYRLHVRSLLTWCAQRGLSAADAADVTAETFIAALHRRHGIDAEAESGTAEAWLHQLAFDIVAKRHRSSARERAAYERLHATPVALTERDIAEYAELREQARETLEWVTGLVPAQEEALLSNVVHGTASAEHPTASGPRDAAIRRRVSRAVVRLRRRRGEVRS